MAVYYLRVDGNNANAGTSDTSGGAWRTIARATSTVAAGDTVYIRGAAGTAASWPTSSPDYTEATYLSNPSGSVGSGFIKWIGIGSMPVIQTDGLIFFNSSYNWFENLYFYAAGPNFYTYGVINGTSHVIANCWFNLNNQDNQIAAGMVEGEIVGCNIYGGTASPVLYTSSDTCAIRITNYNVVVQGNRIWNCRGPGINMSVGGTILGNLIYGNAGDGIQVTTPSNFIQNNIIGNTIANNGGHGITISGTDSANVVSIRNNSITGHVASGKSGIICATSGSDIKKKFWAYNNVWNNGTNYTNVTAHSTDLNVDPDFVDEANGDFTPTNVALLAGFPTAF